MFCDDSFDFLNMSLTRLRGWGDKGVKTKFYTLGIFIASVFPCWVLLDVMTKKVESGFTILTEFRIECVS